MSISDTRWILAFDASCGTCREMAGALSQASACKVEVLPLSAPEVCQWREQALGAQPRWAPTLLRVQPTGPVHAWIGAQMGLPLMRRIGPRSTVRVLQRLGQIRRQAQGHPLERDGSTNAIGRARFLRLGAGAAVAVGIMLTGRTPAFAEQTCAAAHKWAEENKDQLPQHYDEIVAYPMGYRLAIYSRIPSAAKSRFWVEHLQRYQSAHPNLSQSQRRVVDTVVALASQPSTFASDRVSDEVGLLADTVKNVFSDTEARALVATIGPADQSAITTNAQAPICECSDASPYCSDCRCQYRSHGCLFTNKGCGFLGLYVCNGLCEC
ncbi:bacteriocin fulvocin C-related protein [Streptomyces sp. KLMMK]|uniref:bacteriocin fulvocin C-related protein n=1 Tax=Streptomyces sp. KLMMK TaxID=3109353 RepID=UPI00300025F8